MSSNEEWAYAISSLGFAVCPDVFAREEIQHTLNSLEEESLRKSRAGIRHALRLPAVCALARDPRLLSLAQLILGQQATPYRATVFDKSLRANWLVVWHQDTALPITEKGARPGWGPWSKKDGVLYAHAPAHALSHILALRVHLDDSLADNGPLRGLPGTHTLGVLTDDQISDRVIHTAPVELTVPAGGVIGMRPLLVHASSKSRSKAPRRVLHIEYGALLEIDGLHIAIT